VLREHPDSLQSEIIDKERNQKAEQVKPLPATQGYPQEIQKLQHAAPQKINARDFIDSASA
jgi:hypothetical protein